MLQAYIHKYTLQSVTFLEFRLTFMDFVRTTYDQPTADALLAKIDWPAWIQVPGDNPKDNGLDFTTPNATEFSKMADFYVDNGGEKSPEDMDKYKTAISSLKVIFGT